MLQVNNPDRHFAIALEPVLKPVSFSPKTSQSAHIDQERSLLGTPHHFTPDVHIPSTSHLSSYVSSVPTLANGQQVYECLQKQVQEGRRGRRLRLREGRKSSVEASKDNHKAAVIALPYIGANTRHNRNGSIRAPKSMLRSNAGINKKDWMRFRCGEHVSVAVHHFGKSTPLQRPR
jgi:hypothetical protein